jgi:hypothetical protein
MEDSRQFSLPQLKTSKSASFESTKKADLPLISEHWKIRKKKTEFDTQINEFYGDQITQCSNIEETTNRKSEELYNSIFYDIKWSNPSVSAVHGKLILQYCKHLIRHGSTVPFPNESDLKAWNIKCHATKREKISTKLKKMYLQLFKVIETRDKELNRIQNNLLLQGEDLRMKRDSTLRWMMETNESSQRIKFFTIWDLCIRNKLPELKIHIKAKIKETFSRSNNINTKNHNNSSSTGSIFSDENDELQLKKLQIDSEIDSFPEDIEKKDITEQLDVFPPKEFSVIDQDPILQFVFQLVNEKDPDFHLTPLHYACKNNHFRIVKFLLFLGANPTTLAPDGRSSLHYAASYGNKNIINLLLSLGVDAFQPDLYSCKPIDLAKQNKNRKTIPLLQQWESATLNLTNPEPFVEEITEAPMENRPEEYEPIDDDSFQRMTMSLKILTNRLNGLNPFLKPIISTSFPSSSSVAGEDPLQTTAKYMTSNLFSLSSKIDPQQSTNISFLQNEQQSTEKILTEVRLCTKHFILCIQENMLKEALQSLHRRWRLARILYLKHSSKWHDRVEGLLDATNSFSDDNTFQESYQNESITGRNNNNELQEEEEEEETEPVKDPAKERPIDLETLANEFYKTATNITYLEEKAAAEAAMKALSFPEPPSAVFHLPPIVKVSDKLFIEEENSQTLTENQQEHEQQAKNPEYLLQIINYYVEHERIKKLQEMSANQSYELIYNPMILSSKYSSTISFIDENSVTISSIDFSAYQPFSSYFERLSSRFKNDEMKKNTIASSLIQNNENERVNYNLSLGYDLVEIYLLLKDYSKGLLLLEEILFYKSFTFISSRILFLLQKCDILLYIFDHYQEYRAVLKDSFTEFFFGRDSQYRKSELEEELQKRNLDSLNLNILTNEENLNYLPNFIEKNQFVFHYSNRKVGERSLISNTFSPISGRSLVDLDEEDFQQRLGLDDSSNAECGGTAYDEEFLRSQLETPHWLLLSCTKAAQEIMDLSYLISSKYILEPYSVALALFYLGKTEERKGDYLQAWKYMEEAGLIAVRSKEMCFETIDILLQVIVFLVLFYFSLH